MTDPEQQALEDAQLDLHVLRSIATCGSYMPLKHTLVAAVLMVAAPRPMASHIDRRLRDLDARGLINPIHGAIGWKYALTDAGRAHLQEHG